MSAAARRGALPWAIMVMELSLLYPLAVALLGGQGVSPVRWAAGLAMLPLGYLLAVGDWLPASLRDRLAGGAAIALALRLASTGPPSPLTPAALLGWALAALWPAAIGLGLAWRGVWLAEVEASAEGVRQEFAMLGGVLLVVLGIYADPLGIDSAMRVQMVLLYLGGGLPAIGLARQAAAGAAPSPASSALVALCAALLLLLGGSLVVLLSPPLVSAVLALAREALLVLLQVLLFPLMLLLSWLQLQLPAPPEQSGQSGRPPPPAPPSDLLPAWLVQALGIGLVVAAVIVSVLVLLVLVWLLWELLGRLGQRQGRRPVAVERDGGPRDLLAGLLGALQRWLGGVALPRWSEPLADARACYRALLRWARGRGVEREPAETPAELRARLAELVPEAEAALAALTAAYERARYGGQPVSGPELARLRQHLQALASAPARPREPAP